MSKPKPKPYSPTTNLELKAVQVLEGLFDVDKVKSFINKHDKLPNHDGRIEVTKDDQIVGEFSVQVKKMDPKRPLKYSFESSFYAYCINNLNPVIAFLVDVKNRVAYWHYFDEETLATPNFAKAKSVTLAFKTDRTVDANGNYISLWTEILRQNLSRKLNYTKLNTEATELRKRFKILSKLHDPSIGKKNKSFAEIHNFLDTYNHLLDVDFRILKEALYHDIWKFGIAIKSYGKDHLDYIGYPIEIGKNDTLIKQITSENENAIQSLAHRYTGFNKDNPIKKRPTSYAYELIWDDLKTMLKDQDFLLNTDFLAQEMLIAFIDEYHELLNLKPNSRRYRLSDLKFGIQKFLPLWLDTAGLIAKPSEGDISVATLDDTRWHMDASQKKIVTRNTLIRIVNDELIDYPFEIDFEPFLWDQIVNSIKIAEQHTFLTRCYPIKISPRKNVYYQWQQYTPTKMKDALSELYKQLPTAFDFAIKTFFPNLQNEIKFYDGITKIVILVGIEENPNFPVPVYSHNVIFLQNLDCPDLEETEVFSWDLNDRMPFDRNFLYSTGGKPFQLNEKHYKIVNMMESAPNIVFERLPLYELIYDTLYRRFKQYFALRTGMKHIS